MYFSLITPDGARQRDAVHQRLDAPYADHQWLWNWFPAEPGTPRDFLFRRSEMDGLPCYHVLSHRVPLAQLGAWRAQTREYAPLIGPGDRLRFELRANPTVRHGRDGKSKRHDVVMEAKKKLLATQGANRWRDLPESAKPALYDLARQACAGWLARKGEALGFVPDRDSLVLAGYDQHHEKPDQRLQFSTVDLAGEITVTDARAFKTALLGGVGGAKAFGCGLLLVRRAA